MDAVSNDLEDEKQRLLDRLAEIMSVEQRASGTFDSVPHMSSLEQAGRALGRQLSVAAIRRAVREAAALSDKTARCPVCDHECDVGFAKRMVHSLEGLVELLEPKAHCPVCRRDFFPSAGNAGAR
jgi:hypothetical protein